MSSRIETVDMPEDDFTLPGAFGDNEIVVEFYTVDVVCVDRCCGKVGVRISFGEIGCRWDCC